MAGQPFGNVLRYLRRAASVAHPDLIDRLTDGQLVERFVSGLDPSAFEAIVQRHGPLVWGVCRRVAYNAQDAEDAFQATFLVLTRKAGFLEKRASLGSWLYGVAFRIALRANANAARRRIHEQQAADMATTTSDAGWEELRPLLDAELSRLPEKFRAPLVLCYMEGKTNEQAARELGWPAGSLSKRLARGREMLRERLASKGAVFAGALLGTTLAQNAASAAVPAPLVDLTTSIVQAVAAGKGMALASTPVAALTEGAMQAMWFAKLKLISLVAAGCVAVAGSALLAQQVLSTAEKDVPAAKAATDPLLPPEQFAALQQLLKPGPEDSRWLTVPWMPSSNIWAARQKAAQEGKPLFLWYMAGEPLGQC